MLATPRPGRDGHCYPDGSGPFAVTIRGNDGGFPFVDVARSKAGRLWRRAKHSADPSAKVVLKSRGESSQ